MDTPTVVLICIAVFSGAFVQGLSGLGFPLVVSPVVTQIVPGTGAVGLVNGLSIVQNIWLIARTKGSIEWREIFRMLPGLSIGIFLGWLILQNLNEDLFPLIVAISATASMIWLVFSHRFGGALAGGFSAVWSGTVNTIAGVGGPPIASYLISRKITMNTYLRTLQVIFAVIDLVSLPILGIYAPSVWAIVAWVAVLFAGSVVGERSRGRLSEATARNVGKYVILVVCLAVLIRSIAVLLQG